ncbi:MAG: amidohydrolase family protein [Peptococcaceae bacterium]|nr:amidohydrolase family protein [Peptococcaceae bacterium]
MIIDVHTHVFPDHLAPKAMDSLLDCIEEESFTTEHDGTVAGLLTSMDEAGIDISVLQPVVTKPEQVRSVNEWVHKVVSDNPGRLVGFGGIYPHSKSYKEDIDFVVGLGLKGLKFHAEYQAFVLDEKKMLRIYDYALSQGLILLHHAGFDPAYTAPFRTSPRQFLEVSRAMGGGVIIAAHFGGCYQWDEVETYLAGSDVYLDTSIGFEHFSHDLFLRVVRKHGAEKILFATDSPWSHAQTEIAHLKSLPLSDLEKSAILGGNALSLLKSVSLVS